MIDKMRIGIVTAHYMPEVGYQEVHLARAYARTGHTVKVFTSAATVNLGGDINRLQYQTGLSKDARLGYEILRLPSWSFKSKVIPFGLKKAVEEFKPDVLVILGVAKMFPMPLLSARFSDHIKMVSVYGDAKEYLDRGTLKQKLKTMIHELGYATLKKSLYRRAVKHCNRIILNIPETDQVFNGFLSAAEKKAYDVKKVMLNLGYDPDEYYFSEQDRAETRKELGFAPDDVVIITSTRVNKRKNLEQIITLVSDMNKAGKKVKYVLVGFLGDAYEQELKAFIHKLPDPSVVTCFPFLNAKEIRKLYCAADTGIWLKAAISIQESMGTGLPVILEQKPSVSHLVKDGANGWFFNKGHFDETVQKVVTELSAQKKDRVQLAAANAVHLSYDEVAKKILATLD